jgi:hypothetical protein
LGSPVDPALAVTFSCRTVALASLIFDRVPTRGQVVYRAKTRDSACELGFCDWFRLLGGIR